MFAVIKTGGKQYRVKEGDVISVEKLEAEKGQVVNFDQVLLLEDGQQVQVGTPYLEKATVAAEILDDYKDEKVIIFKKKRRKGYRRTRGHRQVLTRIRIAGIYPEGKSVEGEKPATEPAPAPRKTRKKETTEKESKPASGKATSATRKTSRKETTGKPKEK